MAFSKSTSILSVLVLAALINVMMFSRSAEAVTVDVKCLELGANCVRGNLGNVGGNGDLQCCGGLYCLSSGKKKGGNDYNTYKCSVYRRRRSLLEVMEEDNKVVDDGMDIQVFNYLDE